jgi:hypothetical protein
MNFYEYAVGNPIAYRDPTGQIAWILAGAAIGAGANLAATIIANGGFNGLTAQQVGAALASGAVAGAIASVAGPVAGSFALQIGWGSTGFIAAFGTGVLSAGGSALGQEIANLIDPCHNGSLVNAAFWGGVGAGAARYIFPSKNLNTLAQAQAFGASSLSGLFGSANAWLNNVAATTGAAVGAAAN